MRLRKAGAAIFPAQLCLVLCLGLCACTATAPASDPIPLGDAEEAASSATSGSEDTAAGVTDDSETAGTDATPAASANAASEGSASETDSSPSGSRREGSADPDNPTKEASPVNATSDGYRNGIIPLQLESIPEGYRAPAAEQGTLERLDYDTYESFSYDSRTQPLRKTAWVYIPYGYDPAEKHDVLYLSHGGWSNETSLMGTDASPTTFKSVVDHAIADGLIEPIIMVMPTYNNTSPEDSGDYSLALRLTDNFHNELVNDLLPAVESKYTTYAEDVTPEGLRASRDHRAFGGFSMGGVNTWHSFQYCLGYFRNFMPMSGGAGFGGAEMAQLVRDQGFGPEDLFIFAMTGTEDFAHDGFRQQIAQLASTPDGTFVLSDNLSDGNLAYREREGYRHDGMAADEYTYNGLRLFFAA